MLPCSSLKVSQIEYLPLAVLEQYTLLRDSNDVSSVMAKPYNCWLKMWLIRFCLSGILVSKPCISRFAISRKNTPLLETGSKNLAFGFLQSSAGSKSKISFTKLGGVNTSSLLKLARQDSTSGL
jgi:hypothetical protein